MILALVIFLPCFACLFSLLVHLKIAARTAAFKSFCLFIVTLGVFLFTDSCFTVQLISDLTLSRMTLVGMLVAPSIIPLLIMFLRRSRLVTREDHPVEMLWVLVPVILFTASLMLYIIIGEQSAVKITRDMYTLDLPALLAHPETPEGMYLFVAVIVFRIVMTIETLWMGAYFIVMAHKEGFQLRHAFGFYFRGEEAKTVGLLTLYALPAYFLILAKFLFLRQQLREMPVLMVLFAILMTFFIVAVSYIALFASRRSITRKDMRNAWRYNYSEDNKAVIVEEMLDDLLDDAEKEALMRIQEKIAEDLHIDEFRSDGPYEERASVAQHIFSAVSDSWGEDKLLARFQKLMKDDLLFLQPRLSLDDVALKLNTNKVYISKLVNNAYNLGFPELINILRVDYAEQYILSHADARQDEIARECGFLSASSFNTTFKKVTGVTPKVWVASQRNH